ncbi:5-formyltetrahydrofolate cyclo-ligase [Flexibacterium corallicola]|uniref:5-formyltetrahydrofolate cyclo-ligase n=1 Tax=Flexibacterium corallicola TaxID=3037259 RepID=UPI00286EEC65|nr:5-formyltetrahydrofolate cyclo-ligase [Pseudovibrio sp. M1P-2-3]
MIETPPVRFVQKEKLRKTVKQRRTLLLSEQKATASRKLVSHLHALALAKGMNVAGYWPINGEIDPRPLMEALKTAGAKLCLPVVDGEKLIFRHYDGSEELQPAGFGSYGPPENAPVTLPDLLLLPLLAFDKGGNRLGYGGGFYDRAIQAIEKEKVCLRIGLAFSCQQVEEVPVEPHDQKLDGILTEDGFLSFKRD